MEKTSKTTLPCHVIENDYLEKMKSVGVIKGD